jgi:hypothetical protein
LLIRELRPALAMVTRLASAGRTTFPRQAAWLPG